jgi:hypothetical protein
MTKDNAESAAPKAALPMFKLNGEPLKLPPEFAIALAHVVVEWSRLEDAIASDLNWMSQFQVVADLAKEHPRAFKRILELWRRAVDTLFEKVPDYRDLVAAIVPRVQEVVKVRNILIHGAWPLDNPTPEGRFRVINMRAVGGGKIMVDTVEVDETYLLEMTEEILELAGLVIGLTMTRMLHGHYGLLRGTPPRAPDQQAGPKPPAQERP